MSQWFEGEGETRSSFEPARRDFPTRLLFFSSTIGRPTCTTTINGDYESNSRALSITRGAGNARQKIVRDDADRRRLIDGLEHTVIRHGWELLCYVVSGQWLGL